MRDALQLKFRPKQMSERRKRVVERRLAENPGIMQRFAENPGKLALSFLATQSYSRAERAPFNMSRAQLENHFKRGPDGSTFVQRLTPWKYGLPHEGLNEADRNKRERLALMFQLAMAEIPLGDAASLGPAKLKPPK